MCVCVCVHAHVHMHVCRHEHVCVCVHMHVCVGMSMCVCVHMHVCVCVLWRRFPRNHLKARNRSPVYILLDTLESPNPHLLSILFFPRASLLTLYLYVC